MQILPISSATPETIVQLAERRLRESPYFYLRRLRCQFDDGVLTVRGQVPYRQLQEFAEVIVARIEGVREVVNRIEVYDPTVVPGRFPAVRNAG